MKKTSRCSTQKITKCKTVELPACVGNVPSESSSSQMKENANGHSTVALRKSATTGGTSVCASASDFGAAPSVVGIASSLVASEAVQECPGNTITGNAPVSSSSGVIELSM